MSDNNQLPIWFPWVQLLTPAFIALVVLIITAWIQIGQSRTGRAKLKLDLFKERYELLQIMSNMIRAANTKSDDFLFEMHKEYEKFRQYGLLFPKNIADDVNRLSDLCYTYQSLREETKDLRGTPEWVETNKKWRAIQSEVEKLASQIRIEIEEFIRVDWKE